MNRIAAVAISIGFCAVALAQIPTPNDIKAERDRALPVTYYMPKHVPKKTPGGALGSLLGATEWKIYPIIAYAELNGRRVKVLGLRIDFGTGTSQTPIYPQQIWFYANDQLPLKRAIPYSTIVKNGIYNYRLDLTGEDVKALLPILASAESATMIVFDPALSGGRFSIKFKKQELSPFGPVNAFYDAIQAEAGGSTAVSAQ